MGGRTIFAKSPLRIVGAGVFAMVCAVASPAALADEIYQTPAAFLAETFAIQLPQTQLLPISPEMRRDVERILRHSYGAQRVRYWKDGARTAWILEEIGKYKPITVGLVVADGKLESLRVLIYRESHGWEVRHDFFTEQFKGMT
jgi:hypothetical protein